MIGILTLSRSLPNISHLNTIKSPKVQNITTINKRGQKNQFTTNSIIATN